MRVVLDTGIYISFLINAEGYPSKAITIYQYFRRQGNLIEDADLLRGAIAKTKAATLVTHNIKHFGRIKGLSLVDWQ